MSEKINYINGEWIFGSGPEIESINPANNEILLKGSSASKDDVMLATKAARNAFESWSELKYEERLEYIEKFSALVKENQQDLGELIAKETGKVLWDAMSEATVIAGRADICKRSFAERGGFRQTEINAAMRSELRHKGHGVMAVYGPYNFPAHLPNAHMMPSLLAGNSVVLKPSEQCPKTACFLVELWEKAGIPKGVVNLVQGEAETGIALAASDDIAGILFTGSYSTGKKLHESLAGRPEIMLALEMGGNNPIIVWDADDIEQVAAMVVQSSFITSGQRCTCSRRLILPHGEVGDKYIEAIIRKTNDIIIGLPFDEPAPFMGPLINNKTADMVAEAENNLLKLGAKSIVKSKKLSDDAPLLSPAIIDVTGVDNIPDEEYFGPLLQVLKVDNIDDAIREANNTNYGLAASVITDNDEIWEKSLQKLKAGIINRNRPTSGASGNAPFGGIGHSGNLRPTAYYAVDYCAYPVATLYSDAVKADELKGFK